MQINFKDIDFNQHSSFQQDNVRALHALPLKEQANYLYNLINTFNSSKEEIIQCLYKLNDCSNNSDRYHYLYGLNNKPHTGFDSKIYEDIKQVENYIFTLIKSTSQHNKDNKVRTNFEDLSLFLKNIDLDSLSTSISRKTFSKNLYLSAFFMLGGGKFFKETVSFFSKAKSNHKENEGGFILCSLLYLFLEKSDNKKDDFNKIVKTLFELSKENDSLPLEFSYYFGDFFRDDNIRLSLIEAPKTLSIRFLNKLVFCANEKTDEFLNNRYLGDLSSHFINSLDDFIFNKNTRKIILDGRIINSFEEDYTEALLSLINNPRFERFIINLPESEMNAVKSLLLGFAEKNIVIPSNYFTFEEKDYHILKNPQFIASLLSKYQRYNNTPHFLYKMLVDFYLSTPAYFVEIEKTTLENFFKLFYKADLIRFFLPFIDNMVENGFKHNSPTNLVAQSNEFKNRILNAFGSALQEKEIKGMSELKEAKDLTKGELLTLDFFLLFFVTSLNSDFQHSLMNNWYSLTTGAKLFSGISTLYQKLKDQELNEKETYVFQQLEFFFKTLPELRKIFLSEYEKIREETFNKAKQEQKTNETELTKSTETIKILDEEEIKIIQNARDIFKSLIDSFEIKSNT